jgi:hypothetical protein
MIYHRLSSKYSDSLTNPKPAGTTENRKTAHKVFENHVFTIFIFRPPAPIELNQTDPYENRGLIITQNTKVASQDA